MKKLSILFVPLLLTFASCKKETLKPVETTKSDNTATDKGYLVVQCDNCQVQYGMPDQYELLTVSGTSQNAYFNYKDGYMLKTYIVAYDHTQKLTLSVYDKNAKLIQTNSTTYGTKGYWETNIPIVTK